MSPDEDVYIWSNGCLTRGGHPKQWGFIPGFLMMSDPRPAKEQINERYVSGWDVFKGHTIEVNEKEGYARIKYPGDPPLRSVSAMVFRNELIFLFPYSWVMLKNEKGEWEIARLD